MNVRRMPICLHDLPKTNDSHEGHEHMTRCRPSWM